LLVIRISGLWCSLLLFSVYGFTVYCLWY